jgi:hypothetical protein
MSRLARGQFQPIASIFAIEVSMSSLQQLSTTSVTDMRLAAIAAATARLKGQLSELERLREQIRKAQLLA